MIEALLVPCPVLEEEMKIARRPTGPSLSVAPQSYIKYGKYMGTIQSGKYFKSD